LAKSLVSVLVVDDSGPFRRFVASALAQNPELKIIGESSDGMDAVYKAEETQPNLILLDIGLPTLNGIEAARRIRKLSPASKILFFSENRSREIVEEALHTGAAGYVVKSDAARELLPGVEAILQGRQFVSSILSDHFLNRNEDGHTRQFASAPRKSEIVGRHEALFYSDDRQLLDQVSRFIGAALSSGNAAIVVATGAHRENLMQGLQAYGVDMASAIEQGRYIALDAADTLLPCMVNGALDSVRFLQTFESMILKAASTAQGKHPRVAVFGEGASLLCKQGNTAAAIQDEKLCNQLCTMHDVDILCGYSMHNGEGILDERISQQICAEHSVVYRRLKA
jgi:DNA-binding NarL/FixJ family response regulator